MNTNFKIYSVESRKGGVGKTTMALSLAKCLLSKGPVLILDCDITGTSITPPARNSAFWQKITNVVTDENGKEINLLNNFVKRFMQGKNDINDIFKKERIDINKINVIGSSIYDGSDKSYVDTRLVMDEIHSYWLVEFVFALTEGFAGAFGEKEVSIIIDNSPGYLGFNKSLHLRMAKLGPEKAKFMLVSSFDEQDLQSCLAASKDIHFLVDDRIQIAEYFNELSNDGDINKYLEQKMKDNGDLKQFFFGLVSEDYPIVDDIQRNVGYYLSLVLNKVPNELENEGFKYLFDKVVKDEYQDLFNSITNATDGLPKYMVPYDRNITLQFYSNLLSPKVPDVRNYWNNRFAAVKKRNREELHVIADAVDRLTKVNESYINLIYSMKQKSYFHFANSLPDEWSPSYAFDQLSEMVGKIGTHDYMLEPIIGDAVTKEKIMEAIVSLVHNFSAQIDKPELESSLLSVLKKVATRVGYMNERIPKPTRMVVYFLLVLAFIETTKIEFAEIADVRRVLIKGVSQKRERRDWVKLLGAQVSIGEDFVMDVNTVRKVLDAHFVMFKIYLSNALLRLVDLHEDFEFLVCAFELFIPFKDVMYMSKDMMKYIDDVVVNKNKDRDLKILTDMRLDMANMKALDSVIKNITHKAWK